MRLAGDSNDDRAALERYNRAVSTLERRGYFVPGGLEHREAPSGDSVEIVCRMRSCRTRPGGLVVRASSRFVEAARLAELQDGKGFETRSLIDWAGILNLEESRVPF